MKKVVTILLILCTFATVVAQPTLPYIARDKNTSGKYGFVQQGKEIFPHIFEGARSFIEGESITYVTFGNEHFVIDRKGNMVTDKGYKIYPNIYSRFAVVDRIYEHGIDPSFGIVIDSRGEQLLSGTYAKPVYVSLSEKVSYHLFVVSKSRKTVSGQLLTINGEGVSKGLVGDFGTMQSGAILYVDASTDRPQGVINAWGKVLVPCEYDEIHFCPLKGFHYKDQKALIKAGVMDKYSTELQSRVGVIYAKKGKMVTLYDQSGTQLTPAQEYKDLYYVDVLSKNLRKVIIPHFTRKGDIMRTIQEKINDPNRARYDEYMAAVAKLPIYSESGRSITSHIAYLEDNPNVENYSLSESYTKGKGYYDNRKYEESIPWLLRAAEGKHKPAYRKLADSYNNTKQFQKACVWYKNCVKDLTPGDNDYWYACMILGGMYKAGRGCEKNYDTSLYYLRLFHQNTTPINKQTANEMIAEVVALKDKANPQRQQAVANNSGGSGGSHISTVSSGPRPSYGSIPTGTDIYMKSADEKKYMVMKMNFFTNNGDYILRVNGGGPGQIYKLNQTTSDSYIFQTCREVHSWGGGFNSLIVSYQVTMGHTITIAKDWSSVVSNAFEHINGKKYLTLVASKEEYDQFMKATSAIVAHFESMSGGSGGGGGSSVAPAQIQSGMSAEYYQNLYRQYERLAESAYRSLTSTGVSVRYDDGSREGSTLGSWEGSNYVGMKVELGKAQREMQRIRSEAAREGHHIMQSHWETATVSH